MESACFWFVSEASDFLPTYVELFKSVLRDKFTMAVPMSAPDLLIEPLLDLKIGPFKTHSNALHQIKYVGASNNGPASRQMR
jgi:hypothetical protein